MFQDIAPHCFHNQYNPRPAAKGDYVLAYRNGQVLLRQEGENCVVPGYEDLCRQCSLEAEELTYLFSLDNCAFHLSRRERSESSVLRYHDPGVLRVLQPEWLAFAAATAVHLARWYDAHRYCGRCARRMRHKSGERALVCPACKQVEYPKIAPVVIVGVTDENRLLLTKYAGTGYRNYALVAGFMEIGETFEDTVRREVLEEVGLQVERIRYCGSQPWAFSDSVLAGFYADVRGSRSLQIDRRELSEAVWVDRENLPRGQSTMSLTWDMIERFRAGPV